MQLNGTRREANKPSVLFLAASVLADESTYDDVSLVGIASV